MIWMRSVLVLLVCASFAVADDWPQWLGPRRDGGTSEKVAPWQEPPKVEWRQPVGAGFSVPAIAGGRVFIHAKVADKHEEEVLALDAKTGKLLWRDTYARAVYNTAVGSGPRGTPTVAGKHVYTYGITGVLTCYQTDTGKRLWQVDAYKELKAALPPFGVCCSPLVVGNRVIVSVGGTGSSIAAFDTDKGELQWKGFDEPASTASPVLFRHSGKARGTLPDVVFMTTLRLVAVSPLDGSLNWDFPLVFQPSGTSPTPIAAGDRLITSTITNGTTTLDVTTKDDKPTAARAWQNKELTGYFSTGVMVGKDQLYLVTNVTNPLPSATLQCLDVKSGQTLWSKPGIGYFHAAVLRTGDDHLLILDDTGMLKLVEANAKEYREKASAKVCGGTFVAPALANGLLYVRDDKEVICFRLKP